MSSRTCISRIDSNLICKYFLSIYFYCILIYYDSVFFFFPIFSFELFFYNVEDLHITDTIRLFMGNQKESKNNFVFNIH